MISFLYAYVLLCSLGAVPVFELTSEQVLGLTEDDLVMLRDDFGVSDDMLDQLRQLARVPHRDLLINLADRTVTVK